jgi:hypothetical protein
MPLSWHVTKRVIFFLGYDGTSTPRGTNPKMVPLSWHVTNRHFYMELNFLWPQTNARHVIWHMRRDALVLRKVELWQTEIDKRRDPDVSSQFNDGLSAVDLE